MYCIQNTHSRTIWCGRKRRKRRKRRKLHLEGFIFINWCSLGQIKIALQQLFIKHTMCKLLGKFTTDVTKLEKIGQIRNKYKKKNCITCVMLNNDINIKSNNTVIACRCVLTILRRCFFEDQLVSIVVTYHLGNIYVYRRKDYAHYIY